MTTEQQSTRTRWVLTIVISVYIVIAHGCHGGDHDTELTSRFWEWCGLLR